MRLNKIKLAGFKSFVDPTTIQFVSNLSSVVGPNGCGKSNVIDAVRWVMGESSAKNLRGGSITDVIFNGSTARKPVGVATVELMFENTEGKLGGEYASYSELAIKRQLGRDGQSTYFINGQRCRRRDIMDIFLGTGLGPRSYAIIEQGMISRVIEAKPDDLRVFFEEAAGISKYKERRRETENRIQHTQDNLARLNDLREELNTQLRHLERQSQSAARFKELSAVAQSLSRQIAALAYKRLDGELQVYEQKIRDASTALEARQTGNQQLKTQQEKTRLQHADLSEALNEVQKRYYSTGAEVAKVEQAIAHQLERHEQLKQDQIEAAQTLQLAQAQMNQDEANTLELQTQLEQRIPEEEAADEAHAQASEIEQDAEYALETWRDKTNQLQQDAAQPARTADAQKSKITQLERQIQLAQERFERLENQKAQLQAVGDPMDITILDEKIADLELRLDGIIQQQSDVNRNKEQVTQSIQRLRPQIATVQATINELQGHQAALQTLQAAALGKNSEARQQWMQTHGLSEQGYVAEKIQVEGPWETACETVLGGYLEAIGVSQGELRELTQHVDDIQEVGINLVEWQSDANAIPTDDTRLSYYVKGAHCLPAAIFELLNHVYVARSLDDAKARVSNLQPHESIITAQGFWLGQGWIKVKTSQEENDRSVLAREQKLKALVEGISVGQDKLDALQHELQDAEEQLQEIELQKESLQQDKTQAQQDVVNTQSDRRIKHNRLEANQRRHEDIQNELADCHKIITEAQQEVVIGRSVLEEALEKMSLYNDELNELSSAKDPLHEQLMAARQRSRETKERLHQLRMQVQTYRTQLASLDTNRQRFIQQISNAQNKLANIEQMLVKNQDPVEALQLELQACLERRIVIEEQLNQARDRVAGCDNELRDIEQQLDQYENSISSVRENLERAKLEREGLLVRRENVLEKFKNSDVSLQEALDLLPPDADEAQWQRELIDIENKIQRLGAINLAAIEEFDAAKQRKDYLDAQYTDLTEALTTLENAIKKIDRETRAKFKETFDKVNENFKALFPRLFGGGQAQLEMVGEDLLDTGITVMARPPGKKNSNIALLSGGEKALTAVSLVFSIFQLNPAPFCMLDEVDAPLDDSNVGRFCDLVREMSKDVQFIYISHNKLAIEMAEQLQGVTMREPGVSRLVTVDIEEARSMAHA